jgi:hypothetical protein
MLVIVKIAGRDYGVIRKSPAGMRAWREQVAAYDRLLDQLNKIITDGHIELNDMSAVIRDLGMTIGSISDTALALLCDYAPEIAADRAHIEAEGYDDEIITAFALVFGQARPAIQTSHASLTRSVNGCL